MAKIQTTEGSSITTNTTSGNISSSISYHKWSYSITQWPSPAKMQDKPFDPVEFMEI